VSDTYRLTDRLELRRLALDDAAFIDELLNEPDFRQFIGDKGVRSPAEARAYLRDGPLASYREHGFGLSRVGPRVGGEALGICGLVKRPCFEAPDFGFAFLRRHWSNGYAREAAVAVLDEARDELGLRRILAMVDQGNVSSVRLLEKLGFGFEKRVQMPGETTQVCLYAVEF